MKGTFIAREPKNNHHLTIAGQGENKYYGTLAVVATELYI
jgi:hypothetical protein